MRADLEPWVPLLAPTVGAEVPTTPQVAALDEDFRVEKQVVVLRDLLEALAPGSGCLDGLREPERTYQQLLVLSAVAIRKYRNIRVSMATAGVAGVLIGLALAVTL